MYDYTDFDKRRRLPGKPRKQDVKHLWDQHHSILRMLAAGMRAADIARELDVHVATVSNVRNSPLAKEQLGFLHASADIKTIDVMGKIREILPKCLEVLEEVIDNPSASDAIRTKNALALLDRGGFGPSRNVNVSGEHVVAHLSADQIERIKQRAMDAGMLTGPVIDVEAQSV